MKGLLAGLLSAVLLIGCANSPSSAPEEELVLNYITFDKCFPDTVVLTLSGPHVNGKESDTRTLYSEDRFPPLMILWGEKSYRAVVSDTKGVVLQDTTLIARYPPIDCPVDDCTPKLRIKCK